MVFFVMWVDSAMLTKNWSKNILASVNEIYKGDYRLTDDDWPEKEMIYIYMPPHGGPQHLSE